MKTKNSTPHLPELGEVLKFLLDCFDIRRDGSPLMHKQVERLAKGKDISREQMEKVGRSVLDTIYQQLNCDEPAEGLTGTVMAEWVRDPQRMAGLPVDIHGSSVLSRDQFLKDLIEFCWRHQFLLTGLSDCKNASGSLFFWLSKFVIPYVMSTLVDYHFTASNPESGMPGGRLWYLPGIESDQENASNSLRLLMPSQQVLFWWEDLLGRSLQNHYSQLCGPAADPENARRQIVAWKNEAKPPDSETIRRWMNQTWDYKGIFQDEPSRPIMERWGNAR